MLFILYAMDFLSDITTLTDKIILVFLTVYPFFTVSLVFTYIICLWIQFIKIFFVLSGNRLKARDLFFSGIATHFVDSKEVRTYVHNSFKISLILERAKILLFIDDIDLNSSLYPFTHWFYVYYVLGILHSPLHTINRSNFH